MTEWYRVVKECESKLNEDVNLRQLMWFFHSCYTLGSVLERQELLRAARGGGGQYPLLCTWTLWFARPSCHSVEGCDGGQGISKKMIHLAIRINRITWATLGNTLAGGEWSVWCGNSASWCLIYGWNCWDHLLLFIAFHGWWAFVCFSWCKLLFCA